MGIFLFFLILAILVLSHEFGHFIVAKWAGVRVDEFGFGFPPRLFGVKRGETLYSINAVPFGGFVKIFGEDPSKEPLTEEEKKRSLSNKSKKIQAAVIVAGVFFNFLLAWVFISGGLVLGLPTPAGEEITGAVLKNAKLMITSVKEGSPAAAARLKPGDNILSLQSEEKLLENPTDDQAREFIFESGGNPITLAYLRNGASARTVLSAKEGVVQNKLAIGVSLDMVGIMSLPFFQAIWHGLRQTVELSIFTTISILAFIKALLLGQAGLSSVSGPVGIIGLVGDASSLGFVYLLSLTAMISINLAVLNLVPLPALDGGRLLFVFIEYLKGSPIKPSVTNAANAIGFGLLLFLMLLVTYSDILKLSSG